VRGNVADCSQQELPDFFAFSESHFGHTTLRSKGSAHAVHGINACEGWINHRSASAEVFGAIFCGGRAKVYQSLVCTRLMRATMFFSATQHQFRVEHQRETAAMFAAWA